MFLRDKISLRDIPTKATTSLMFGRWGEVMGGFECFDSSLNGPSVKSAVSVRSAFLFDRGYQRLWNITLCHMFLG